MGYRHQALHAAETEVGRRLLVTWLQISKVPTVWQGICRIAIYKMFHKLMHLKFDSIRWRFQAPICPNICCAAEPTSNYRATRKPQLPVIHLNILHISILAPVVAKSAPVRFCGNHLHFRVADAPRAAEGPGRWGKRARGAGCHARRTQSPRCGTSTDGQCKRSRTSSANPTAVARSP